MQIGKQIETKTYDPKIIPIKLPEKAPATTTPAEQPIPVPNWPQPEKAPATVPAEPEKAKAQ